MRKKLAAFLLCLSTTAVLCGCGGNTGSSDAEKLVKLGDYKSLEIELDKSYEISDDSVKETIESFFLSVPVYTENKDKTEVAEGDVVNIDYKGVKDGEAFMGGTDEGYNLEIGSGTFIDGFEEGLIGKKVGETVDLNLTFPEDYDNEELAGKDVVFTVKINSIQDKSYPEYDTLTDEYVEENYADIYGVKTVKELQDYVSDYLKSSQESAMGDALTEKLKEICEVSEIPDDLLKERTEELKEYYKGLAKSQDQEFEEFLTQNYGITEEEFDEEIDNLMEDYITSDLIWEAIAAKEGIEASGNDYDNFIAEMMDRLSFDTKKDLYEVYPEEMVKRMYIERETKKKLAESVKIKYVETETSDAVEDAGDGAQNEDTGEDTSGEMKDTIDTTTGE